MEFKSFLCMNNFIIQIVNLYNYKCRRCIFINIKIELKKNKE